MGYTEKDLKPGFRPPNASVLQVIEVDGQEVTYRTRGVGGSIVVKKTSVALFLEHLDKFHSRKSR